jgi:serine/threonine protein kinase
MAPELLVRDTCHPSTASDIWALGMVFFELASRNVPFTEARDNEQVKEFVREAKGERIPKDCQRQYTAFGRLMKSCWSSRSSRPSASTLVDELEKINGTVSKSSPALFAQSEPALKSDYEQFARPSEQANGNEAKEGPEQPCVIS